MGPKKPNQSQSNLRAQPARTPAWPRRPDHLAARPATARVARSSPPPTDRWTPPVRALCPFLLPLFPPLLRLCLAVPPPRRAKAPQRPRPLLPDVSTHYPGRSRAWNHPKNPSTSALGCPPRAPPRAPQTSVLILDVCAQKP